MKYFKVKFDCTNKPIKMKPENTPLLTDFIQFAKPFTEIVFLT